MAQANDQQMQQYANERIRVRAEQFRALLNAIQDDKNNITDIYDRAANNTWTDNRTDGPPTLLDQNDVLAFNTFITDMISAIENNAQWPVIRAACVRALSS